MSSAPSGGVVDGAAGSVSEAAILFSSRGKVAAKPWSTADPVPVDGYSVLYPALAPSSWRKRDGQLSARVLLLSG